MVKPITFIELNLSFNKMKAVMELRITIPKLLIGIIWLLAREILSNVFSKKKIEAKFIRPRTTPAITVGLVNFKLFFLLPIRIEIPVVPATMNGRKVSNILSEFE